MQVKKVCRVCGVTPVAGICAVCRHDLAKQSKLTEKTQAQLQTGVHPEAVGLTGSSDGRSQVFESATEAAAWAEAGFRLADAEDAVRMNLSVAEASKLRDEGCPAWTGIWGRFPAEDRLDWIACGLGSRIAWLYACDGYGPEEAVEHHRQGGAPTEQDDWGDIPLAQRRAWRLAGFDSDSAYEWWGVIGQLPELADAMRSSGHWPEDVAELRAD